MGPENRCSMAGKNDHVRMKGVSAEIVTIGKSNAPSDGSGFNDAC